MTSTSGAKISMFGAKSGFVIPKNKLSGSLVPIFQRLDVPAKLGKRKTKWGPDFTQDTTVKKSRVLAYQKRLDQIAQQLESGTLEAETSRDDTAQHLELEKRQAIGEILGLNPRFKAPLDYKPLLKEATLPIHLKEHSYFSFLSLIFGSQGDTQKRLEKETGAKVQVFGTKTGGEKVELSPTDENELLTPWKELYFQISSDTYEKVDAAIAVIELLISSVSGTTEASAAAPPSSGSEDISTVQGSSNPNPTGPSSNQPTDSSVQPPQSQFQQHGLSFPLASSQVQFYQPLNLSAPSLDNRIQDQERPTNSMNSNPLFAQRPLPIPHNTSLLHDSQVPRPPDLLSHSVVAPQGSLAQLGISTAPPYSGSQIQPIGPRSNLRLSTISTSQPVPSSVFRPMPLPDIVSGNMAQSVRPLASNFGPYPVAHQAGTELPSIPFPSNINLKHRAEYASGGSLRPLSMLEHVASRSAGSIPTYPTNTPPRPFNGDFGFLRASSQSAHLSQLAFQALSVSPASQHFGQSFARSQHLGRQMDQSLSHQPALFHGNVRSSNMQNFGPPLPQMVSRTFPGDQFEQHSPHFPPRPVFHHDNLIPRGQPRIHHRFSTGGHQVYDPFSPSDA